jgi:hypothetical protein
MSCNSVNIFQYLPFVRPHSLLFRVSSTFLTPILLAYPCLLSVFLHTSLYHPLVHTESLHLVSLLLENYQFGGLGQILSKLSLFLLVHSGHSPQLSFLIPFFSHTQLTLQPEDGGSMFLSKINKYLSPNTVSDLHSHCCKRNLKSHYHFIVQYLLLHKNKRISMCVICL